MLPLPRRQPDRHQLRRYDLVCKGQNNLTIKNNKIVSRYIFDELNHVTKRALQSGYDATSVACE